MEGEQFPRAGKSYATFGSIWPEVSVSGSQAFGQALMESCEGLIQKNLKPDQNVFQAYSSIDICPKYTTTKKLDQETWLYRTHLDNFLSQNLYYFRPYKYHVEPGLKAILQNLWSLLFLDQLGPFGTIEEHLRPY